MTARDAILDVLPPIYTVDRGSVLHDLVDAVALELDAYAEDLDRMRRTHWFELSYRLGDLERIAALVGMTRRSWETAPLFRSRIRAVVAARLHGSVGPAALRAFLVRTLFGTEAGLSGPPGSARSIAVLVPGLRARIAAAADDPGDPGAVAAAFAPAPEVAAWRPLRLDENPARRVRSAALAARGGRVPYLHRWQDVNHGLDAAVVAVTLVGRSRGRTATPLLLNTTTGQAVGYAGTLGTGQVLTIAPTGDGRLGRALLDGADVTGRVFGVDGVARGRPVGVPVADRVPLLPLQARGVNDWVYLTAAQYDVPGLDATHVQAAPEALREGVFDETSFDASLFPAGTAAVLELAWTEREPAAFRVTVPRGVVALPRRPAPGELAGEVVEGLAADLDLLHAAGVRVELDLRPFGERQSQRHRAELPWRVIPREPGPAGRDARLSFGGRWGDSAFGRSRFE